MPEPRNARSRRTRTALLAAAQALLEERGTESLTIAAVTERAGHLARFHPRVLAVARANPRRLVALLLLAEVAAVTEPGARWS